MSDTPRTEFVLNTDPELHREVVSADFARQLERELIDAQIDRGLWKERAEHAENNCGRAIEIATEKITAELARAMRVVESAQRAALKGDMDEIKAQLWHWEAGR